MGQASRAVCVFQWVDVREDFGVLHDEALLGELYQTQLRWFLVVTLQPAFL
jgi:hypothetical protein